MLKKACHQLKKLSLTKIAVLPGFSRIALSLIIVLIFLFHLSGIFHLPFVDPIENFLYDFRLMVTMPQTEDSRIVIVDIDEKSLAAEGRWPWGRDRLAAMVDTLFDHYHANLVGFDMVFAEMDESSGLKFLNSLAENTFKDNQSFINALNKVRPSLERDYVFAKSLKSRPVILSYYFQPTWQNQNKTTVGSLPAPVFELSTPQFKKLPFVDTNGYIANLEQLSSSAAGCGYFDNPLVDADGMFRRAPMVQKYNEKLYESFSLAVVRLLVGSPKLEFEIAEGKDESSSLGLEWLKVGGLRIPVDEKGAVLIPYRGRQGSFPYVSAVDILTQKVDPELLQGSIILVGSTTPGLKDLRSTPVQNVYPGIEIHANLISGILDQTIKHKPSYVLGIEFVLLILVGIIITLLLSKLPPLGAILSALIVTGASVWFNFYLWEYHNLVVGVSSILLLVFLLFVFHMSYGFFKESYGKKQISKIFVQYVPPELVKEMSENPSDYGMSGESREMTVLFSDIRNFTTISETMDPKQLTQFMNEIFTFLTQIIYKHRGTIDKYIGDEIMAFWGAPLPDENHADHALEAALEMIAELPKLHQSLRKQNWPEIEIGIGINTGTMSVGNMGSEYRMAYTVLGDAVNLGSRITALTKVYHTPIIVSEFTQKKIEAFKFQEIDRVRVKGRAESVTIVTPLEILTSTSIMTMEDREDFMNALAHYRNQRWMPAEEAFMKLKANAVNPALYALFLHRIHQFHSNPPEENWDGVYTF